MSAPLVFVDTETTGLHPGRRAWEVAMIRVEPDSVDGIGRGTSFFISDVDLRNADPAALRVGRFYDRHPQYTHPDGVVESTASRASMRTERQAAIAVERWTRDAIIVGSNPGFDVEVLDQMLRHHGLSPAWHYRPIDVATLAAGWLHGMHAAAEMLAPSPGDAEDPSAVIAAALADPAVLEVPWSSDALSAAVGLPAVPESERHTAMGDARWCQRLFNLITTGRVVPPLAGAETGGAA